MATQRLLVLFLFVVFTAAQQNNCASSQSSCSCRDGKDGRDGRDGRDGASQGFGYKAPIEQDCTLINTGLVRYISSIKSFEVCYNRQWIPYNLKRSPPEDPPSGLIGHWKMDEETGQNVDDDSGHEHHGIASGGPVPSRGKFSRGRKFDSSGVITIKDSPTINFGQSSFTVSGWLKIIDVTYPRTTFAVRKGYGCYLPSKKGWVPGWELGHGYKATGLDVCIRDQNKFIRTTLVFDDAYQPPKMIGKWVHYACVFDRQAGKVIAYVNGKRQSRQADISGVIGSVNNNKDLDFGNLYGWTTRGTMDEYRLYNQTLQDDDVKMIYENHRV